MDVRKCADCPATVDEKALGERARKKGSSIREPGEVLCAGCTSSRIVLVRKMDRLPSKLDQIVALRMTGAVL